MLLYLNVQDVLLLWHCFLTLMSSCLGLARLSSISILFSVSCMEAKGSGWSAAPLGAGGSWLGVSRYVMMGEKAGCCSREGGVGNIRWSSATAESRQKWRQRHKVVIYHL